MSKQKLSNYVYDQIKDRILTNQYRPGDRLSETQIADEFDMSRTPVREAIKILSKENLVEVHNGAGIFVKMVTLKEIVDIFQVRMILECSALKLAWENIALAELEELESLWVELSSRIFAGEKVNSIEIANMDSDLHLFIAQRCSNKYLADLLIETKERVRRFQQLSAESLGNAEETVRQHLEILQLMKCKNQEAALSAMKKHIQNAMDYIVQSKQYVV